MTRPFTCRGFEGQYRELDEYQAKVNRERAAFWSEVLRRQRELTWDDAIPYLDRLRERLRRLHP